MPDNNKFINLEELSKITQALLSKINEQSNLKVNKNNVKSELSEGTKIGSIEGVEFYAPEIDTSDLITYDELSNVAYSGSYNDLSNQPSLATVATSGSYNDLNNKPSIINWNHLPILTIYNSEYSTWYVEGSAFLSRLSYLPDFGTIPLFIFLTSKIQNENRTHVAINFQDDPQVSQTIYFYDKSKNPVNVPFYLQPGIYYAEYDTKKEYYYLYIGTQAGNALTISGHTVATDVPADAVFTDTIYDDTTISSRVTTLENAGYQNSTQVNSAIATAIGNINQFEVAIVTDLPTTDIDIHTIYFKSNSSSGNNVYDEYMYINNNWELIGSTAIDLTPYALSANLATVATSGDYDDLLDAPAAELDVNVENMLDNFNLDYTSNSINLNAAGVICKEITITDSGIVSQSLNAGCIYHFTGDLTELTITLNSTSGLAYYNFDFTTGSNVPVINLPNTVIMQDDYTISANKHYEISILNNYGAVAIWTN